MPKSREFPAITQPNNQLNILLLTYFVELISPLHSDWLIEFDRSIKPYVQLNVFSEEFLFYFFKYKDIDRLKFIYL